METAFYDGEFRSKRRVILTNDKHNTSVVLICHPDEPLTRNQVKRSREQLCGIEGCECNKGLGIHGPQAYEIIYEIREGWKILSKQLKLF